MNNKLENYRYLFAICVFLSLIWLNLPFFNTDHRFEQLLTTLKLVDSPLQEKKWLSDANYDEYCSRHGPWSSIRNLIFFKKSSSFYFVDLNMIMLNVLQHYTKEDANDLYFNLTIRIEPQRLLYERQFNATEYKILKNTRYRSHYGCNVIKIDFNLRSFLKDRNLNDDGRIRMRLYVTDIELNITQPVDLTIKEAGLYKKKTGKIVVCAKFVSLEHDYEFRNFKTWVEYNRHLGYDKLVVYYQDAFMSPDKSDYFVANRDFLQLEVASCFPNIVGEQFSQNRYFRTYDKSVNQMFTLFDTISAFAQSECYLEHMDKYDYVIVLDSDEIAFVGESYEEVNFESRRLQNFLLNHTLRDVLGSKANLTFNLSSIRLVNDDLHKNAASIIQKRKNVPSLQLPYKLFLDNSNIANICRQLYYMIEAHRDDNLTQWDEKEFYFHDLDNVVYNEEDRVRNFTVRAKGRAEIMYALYLCELNRRLVEPLMRKYGVNDSELMKTTFARFFYLRVFNGKSLHDTRRIFLFNTHSAMLKFKYEDNVTKVDPTWPDYDEYKLGFTAHYRFDPKMDYYFKIVNITHIRLDLSTLRLFFGFFFND